MALERSIDECNLIADVILRDGLLKDELELRCTSERGRGVFVGPAIEGQPPVCIERGAILHEEGALCFMAATPLHCDCCRCKVRPGHRVVCSSCQSVVWCGGCAASAYLEHSASNECKVFAEIDRQQTIRGVPRRQFWLRFAARAILAAAHSSSVTKDWRVLLDLHGVKPIDEGDNDDSFCETRSDAVVLHSSLMSFFHLSSSRPLLPTQNDLNQLLVAIGSNAIALHAVCSSPSLLGSASPPSPVGQQEHHLKGRECEVVAWALFCAVSMYNHSCAPNARWGFEGTTITIRSTRRICSPEEVTVSYLPYYNSNGTVMTRQQRRDALLGFGFICRCSRCEEEKCMCHEDAIQNSERTASKRLKL